MNLLLKHSFLLASPLAFGLAGSLLHAAPAGSKTQLPPPPLPAPVATVATAPTAAFFNLSPASGSVVHAPQFVLRGKITHDIYPAPLITATLNGRPIALDTKGNFATTVRLLPGNNDFTLRASTPNPRQQITGISTFIDGSMIYGSDATTANSLRAFVGGALKTSAGNLPPLDSYGFFLAGDIRANENIELTSIHALFVREHNSLASAIAAANPSLSDEQIYQSTRRRVVAEVQAITYHEFLPALLGPNALRPYAGYNPDVNPGLATEFSTAAYRIGHTMINDDVEFLDNDGKEIIAGLPLAQAFFNPEPLKEVGPDPVLKYLASDDAQEVDTQLVDGLRDFLFGPPGAGGLDLASLNIQRGRDHGLADYNSVRRAYGLPSVISFAQITTDPVLQEKLQALYGNVNSLDLWITGLAEDHLPGSSVGPTFQRIIAQQFERTRDGDHNWYESIFAGPQLAVLQATRLSDIIRRNTTITKLQDNVFFFDPSTPLAELVAKTGGIPRDLVAMSGPLQRPASLDGSGNNPFHYSWGAAGEHLLRFARAAYTDDISTPGGDNRPNPRLISNSVARQTTELSNRRNMSSYVYGWGQFIDHDLGLTLTGDEEFDIPVPTGDPSFDPLATGVETIPFDRSDYDTRTGTATATVAQRIQRIIFKPMPPVPAKLRRDRVAR